MLSLDCTQKVYYLNILAKTKIFENYSNCCLDTIKYEAAVPFLQVSSEDIPFQNLHV